MRVAALGILALVCVALAGSERFAAFALSEFDASLLRTMAPSDAGDTEGLPSMYPRALGFYDTPKPKSTRMRFRGPGGRRCDCPLPTKEDSVCLWTDGQAFSSECVANCYGHSGSDIYACKVKLPLYRKLN